MGAPLPRLWHKEPQQDRPLLAHANTTKLILSCQSCKSMTTKVSTKLRLPPHNVIAGCVSAPTGDLAVQIDYRSVHGG